MKVEKPIAQLAIVMRIVLVFAQMRVLRDAVLVVVGIALVDAREVAILHVVRPVV